MFQRIQTLDFGMGGLHWGKYIGFMRVMTVHLDEVLTLDDHGLCGLVPNAKKFHSKHILHPSSRPHPLMGWP